MTVSTSASIRAKNITWSDGEIAREHREERNGHRGACLWFTGLSGSGKSTLARRVEEKLFELGMFVYVLDGDNVRHGLNKDLGFSPEDRTENIRRIGEVSKLFTDAGAVTVTAFISPYRSDRDQVRKIMKEGDFFEVFVSAPLEVCEQRDPKGLYKKARAGQIPEFTGISAPYEEPLKPELVIDTAKHDLEQCVEQVLAALKERNIISR